MKNFSARKCQASFFRSWTIHLGSCQIARTCILYFKYTFNSSFLKI